MKSLAQLKRDLIVGTQLKCIYNKHTQKNIGIIRTIKYVDTTGVYLSEDMEIVAKGSFLGFPKADRLAYQNDVFSLYTQGECELTYQIL